MIGSTLTVIFLDLANFARWLSSIGEGLLPMGLHMYKKISFIFPTCDLCLKLAQFKVIVYICPAI